MPVPSIAMARTSTCGSRSSTASAAMSLMSTSVSTMTGIVVVAGSAVAGAGVATGLAQAAATTRSPSTTRPRATRRTGTVPSMRAWYRPPGSGRCLGSGTSVEPDPLAGEPLLRRIPREEDQHLERDWQPAGWGPGPRSLVRAGQRRDLEDALRPDHDL